MMRRVTETYRILPPSINGIGAVALAGWGLVLFAYLVFVAGFAMPWPLWLLGLAFVLLGVWGIGLLMPGSPADYIEFAPSGLIVAGPLGRRHRAWQDIDRFRVTVIPLRGAPFAWVRAIARRGGRQNIGFGMGGYVKLGWSDDIQECARDLEDWFAHVKAAYTGGNHSGTLPQMPEWFVGRLIAPSWASDGVAV